VRTIGDFQDDLQRALAWRKREVGGIRASVRRSKADKCPAVRGGLVLLYSHWEGFLKESVQHYIDFVFSQNLKIEKLTPNFVAIAYFSDVVEAAKATYPGSELNHLKLARRLLQGTSVICNQGSWRVDTGGDAGSETYQRLMNSIGVSFDLGMDRATWEATRVFIDEHLARDRHRIAHGQGFYISKQDLLDRAIRLTALQDRLLSSLVAAASAKQYETI